MCNLLTFLRPGNFSFVHYLRLWKPFPKAPPVPHLRCSHACAFSYAATPDAQFSTSEEDFSQAFKVDFNHCQISFSDLTILFSSAQPNAKRQIIQHPTLPESSALPKGIFLYPEMTLTHFRHLQLQLHKSLLKYNPYAGIFPKQILSLSLWNPNILFVYNT